MHTITKTVIFRHTDIFSPLNGIIPSFELHNESLKKVSEYQWFPQLCMLNL